MNDTNYRLKLYVMIGVVGAIMAAALGGVIFKSLPAVIISFVVGWCFTFAMAAVGCSGTGEN